MAFAKFISNFTRPTDVFCLKPDNTTGNVVIK